MKYESYAVDGVLYADIAMLNPPSYYNKANIEGSEKLLSKSLDLFEIKSPLIVNTFKDREGTIVNGVQVYLECKKRNFKNLPVWEVSVDEEKEKVLHFTLNTVKTEFSVETLKTILAASYNDFFLTPLPPELDYDCREINEKGDSDVQTTFKPLIAKQTLRTTPFRYTMEDAKLIEKAKELSGCTTINMLLKKLVKEYVEREGND